MRQGLGVDRLQDGPGQVGPGRRRTVCRGSCPAVPHHLADGLLQRLREAVDLGIAHRRGEAAEPLAETITPSSSKAPCSRAMVRAGQRPLQGGPIVGDRGIVSMIRNSDPSPVICPGTPAR